MRFRSCSCYPFNVPSGVHLLAFPFHFGLSFACLVPFLAFPHLICVPFGFSPMNESHTQILLQIAASVMRSRCVNSCACIYMEGSLHECRMCNASTHAECAGARMRSASMHAVPSYGYSYECICNLYTRIYEHAYFTYNYARACMSHRSFRLIYSGGKQT